MVDVTRFFEIVSCLATSRTRLRKDAPHFGEFPKMGAPLSAAKKIIGSPHKVLAASERLFATGIATPAGDLFIMWIIFFNGFPNGRAEEGRKKRVGAPPHLIGILKLGGARPERIFWVVPKNIASF